MITPVPRTSAIELIRASSDQVRRAAEIVGEIASEAAAAESTLDRSPPPPPAAAEALSRSMTTIMMAQRSFAAALRVEQSLQEVQDELFDGESPAPETDPPSESPLPPSSHRGH
jgi:hypothetical protein